MRDAYIIKKSVKRNPLSPIELIEYVEFKSLVNRSSKLIWSEETKIGKRLQERYPQIKKKNISYLNIDETDEKSFVQLTHSTRGYIHIQFDFKSTKKNLIDLVDLANTIDCNLWQLRPRRQVLTKEIINNRYKRTKPLKKRQTEIKLPKNWIYLEGKFDLFLKVFKPKIENLNASIARINNNNTTNNKIVIIKKSHNKFFVTGIGIKYLYEKEFHPERSEELKLKFENQLNALFEKVYHNQSEDKLKVKNYENTLMTLLIERVQTKSEIMVGKVQKRLF